MTARRHSVIKQTAMQKGGRHGGDIQGIINHLDYISGMGFTQILD